MEKSGSCPPVPETHRNASIWFQTPADEVPTEVFPDAYAVDRTNELYSGHAILRDGSA